MGHPGKREARARAPPLGFYLSDAIVAYDGSASGNIKLPFGNFILSGKIKADILMNASTLSWITDYKILGGNLSRARALASRYYCRVLSSGTGRYRAAKRDPDNDGEKRKESGRPPKIRRTLAIGGIARPYSRCRILSDGTGRDRFAHRYCHCAAAVSDDRPWR